MQHSKIVAVVGVAVTLIGCGPLGSSGGSDPDGAGAEIISGDVPVDGSAQPGTRQNPLPVGVTFLLQRWEVTFRATHQDARQLVGGNVDTGPRPVLVPVELTYVGEGSGKLWELELMFVGGDGLTYSQRCTRVPDDYERLDELFSGARAVVNACAVVPREHIAAGIWLIEAPYDRENNSPGERVFVRLGTSSPPTPVPGAEPTRSKQAVVRRCCARTWVS